MEKEQIRRAVEMALSDITSFGMSPPIPVEVSGRHVHFSKKDFQHLFGDNAELQISRRLSQPGQFMSDLRIRLIGPSGILERVAILGPLRDKTQVEISATDAVALGISPPVRLSGDLAGSAGLHIQAGEKVVFVPECAIIAVRHLHITPDDARSFGVANGQEVDVLLKGNRPLTLSRVAVRATDASALSLHIDYDEANAAGIRSGGTCHIMLGGPLISVCGAAAGNSLPVSAALQNSGRVWELRQEGKNPVLITEKMAVEAVEGKIMVIKTIGKTIVTPQARDVLFAGGIEVDRA